jgi:hypothetical protein
MKRISLAILALCLALPATAQMYKWKDANGKWQYSDTPPPSNVKAEKLRGVTTPPEAPAASDEKQGAAKGAAKSGPKTAAELEQAFRKRQLDAAKAKEADDKKLADARIQEENCKRNRQALAGFEAGGRQSRVDEKGERVFLDEAQIASEIAKARQAIATTCK